MSGPADTSNLPSFFQVNRASMVTVLDHLEGLEGDMPLEDDFGGLEDDALGGLEDDAGAIEEEEYNDDDFAMLTSAGLPEQFSASASLNQPSEIMSYEDMLSGNMNSSNNAGEMMSKALGFMSEPEPAAAPEQVAPQTSCVESIPMPPAPVQQYAPPEPHPLDLPPAPAPVPIKQPCTYARIHNINDVKPAKYMSRYDMKFVISRILYPLNTEDPFADDYYFIQSELRKNNKLKAEAIERLRASAAPSRSGVALVPDLIVPLPTWRDTKQKLRTKLQSAQSDILQKSKEWQEKEQSLGVTNRSNVRNPKKQLALNSVKDIWGDVEGEGSASGAPFNSKLWSVRMTIQKAYDAFYAVQELDQLLKYQQEQQAHKLQAANHQLMMLESSFNSSMESHTSAMDPESFANKVAGGGASAASKKQSEQQAMFEMHMAAVHQVRQQADMEQRQAHAIVQDVMKEREHAMGVLTSVIGIQLRQEDRAFSLNHTLFGDIISTLKGKKLISCLFYLLSPDHRWCIVAVLLNKILQTIDTTTATAASVPGESKNNAAVAATTANLLLKQERETEAKLLSAFLEFVHNAHTFQQGQEQQHIQLLNQYATMFGAGMPGAPPPPPPNAPFTEVLLGHISECLRTIMGSSGGAAGGDKVKLRISLLSNRNRSELLHAMIVCADSMVERFRVVDPSTQQSVATWTQLREEFMCMLDN